MKKGEEQFCEIYVQIGNNQGFVRKVWGRMQGFNGCVIDGREKVKCFLGVVFRCDLGYWVAVMWSFDYGCYFVVMFFGVFRFRFDYFFMYVLEFYWRYLSILFYFILRIILFCKIFQYYTFYLNVYNYLR